MFCAANFRKLARPLADSEKRIKAIYQLLDIERSFVPFLPSSSQHSSSNMSDTRNMPILLDLDKLDSYPTPVQVKKETPATTSSKLTVAPKPNPRTRASMSKKRTGSDTAASASKGFSYEDLSFTDSLEPMTSFLHKGLQHLLNLYTESREAVKVLEARNKKLEITVSDQGKIAEAKTQHYEDKLKKVTQDAEVKLAATQVDHE
ncbi:hypothetical protein HanRHA438_Chr04g0179091 [Helianthus annuus]|uniref:Uncharacterized protein n=1 Tax=Helianthus annuus TaxID=4232 RepID=A0A9K3J9V8_HELAN|nr:hypothetical protein HanXRQr2_Chr04g0169331 [Helianthus annuus]KAJ0581251.1 hypothetical protein HanHA300_Chr04g0138801 [Helianthus annuus]KAJ0589166.1 hypothetical protein HanIR_Chr04g0182961 [Helianthus annuus]KAJ0597197.1 hypothetical protein HanHA89_Chr04g0151761 [Helianthus annuus]KAJ0761545.1 hypothetical protein HanOQP8_Chr04g0151091 [Helianthus annuus]